MNESMFSQIDLIRQDSKDVRDFVKKVFSDREFKSMSKDTDFIKYLKSIYEGTHLDEEHVKFSNRTQNGTITTGSVQTTNETIKEDQDCWDTHKVGNPKTKISSKTGKRVNNCVPKSESVVNEANLRLNKKVKSELDAYLKGTKINSPEHQHAIMMILKGALTDANFHSEAKQLPKFFPKAKQSKYVGTAMEGVIEDKGAAYSKAAKWDGHDIIDAFSFYTSMAIGGSFGKKLETLKESISESVNEANSRDEYDAKEFWGVSKIGIQLHKQFKGRFNKSKFEKALSDLMRKSKRLESTIKIIGRYLNIKPSKLNSYTSGEIIEDQEFIKDSTKKAEQLYKIFVSSNESVNEGKYNYKADALTAYFKGKIDAKELDKIARDDFKSGIATKKELSNFLSNKFTQDVMSDTYGIPAGTLIKRVRGLMKFAEGVSEGKDDFMARHGKADINLKKGYKHHNEDELTKLYDKVGKLTKDKKIKKVDVVFEDKSEIKGLVKKVGNKETKFYDVLSAMEKKYGKQKYRIWLEKSLKDFGVNSKHYDYRTNAGAEEKLFQLGK